jgi:hypothetical protein
LHFADWIVYNARRILQREKTATINDTTWQKSGQLFIIKILSQARKTATGANQTAACFFIVKTRAGFGNAVNQKGLTTARYAVTMRVQSWQSSPH